MHKIIGLCPLCKSYLKDTKAESVYDLNANLDYRWIACSGEKDKDCILTYNTHSKAEIQHLHAAIRQREDHVQEMEKALRRRKLQRVLHEEENRLREQNFQLDDFGYMMIFENIKRKMEEEI